MPTTIRHVLFDADGVIQHLPGGWFAAMEPYVGERSREFLLRAWADEQPALAGDGDFLPVFAAVLLEYGVSTPAEEVYAAVWHRIEVVERSLEIVRAVRAQGLGVHLGTNQARTRAAYMRAELGYDELFDVSCYSCELGATKPDPRFFERAAALIGADPAEILFIDDNERNVEGARAAGMPAGRWVVDDGHAALIALLAGHGVEVPGPQQR